MLLEERYLDLYHKIATDFGTGEPIEVSLEQLSQALYCTPRNIKLIIRKLEEEQYIRWSAGRGRGHRSSITFLINRDKKLLETARQFADKGEYKTAFEWIQKYGDDTAVKQQFAEWMNGQFGYRSVEIDEAHSDVLCLPVYRPILTLDPKDIYYAFTAHMVKQLFDCLVQYDHEAEKVMPSLAHAWECNETGTEWTFYLRKGVQFHHGRDLDPEDVIYSFERLRGSRSADWFIRSIVSIKRKGARSVTFRLVKPNRIFPRFLCSSAFAIVPHDLAAQDEQFGIHPVGTGPFCFVEWTESRFVMKANPSYFHGRAHLDAVTIIFMPEDTYVYSKSWEQLFYDHDLRDEEPEQGWQKKEYITNGCTLLTWNLNKEGPQQTIEFRRAVDLLIDRGKMIRDLGEDRIYAARGFFPDTHLDERESGANKELGMRLLRESGYNGETIHIRTNAIYEPDAQWLKRELAAHGISIEVSLEDWQSIQNPDLLHNTDCYLYCVIFAEDEVCMCELLEQSGSFLREHLSREMQIWVKQRTAEALACDSREDRMGKVLDIERRLRDETHVLFLLHKKMNTFYNPSVRGVGINSLGWIDFKSVWLEKPLANH